MENVRSNAPAAQAAPRAEAAAETSSQCAQDAQNWPNVERRNAARYTVSADAVLVNARSRTRLRGRASDLSLSGCYLDAINLFAVGASVGLRLTAEGHSFECDARVTYSLRGMGMGLVFTKISADQATELRLWVAELSGEIDAAAPPFVPEAPKILIDRRGSAETENLAGWRGILSELINVLSRKGLLEESEAASLRDKLTR